MAEPTDAEFEAVLEAAPQERWTELFAAADALAASEEPIATWSGNEPTGTIVLDGVEKPVYQVPYPTYSLAVERVLSALRALGLVIPYDWMHWDGHERYRGGVGLAQAPVAEAVRMITAVLRGERFGDGTIAAAIESAALSAAIARLRCWHDERR